MTRVPDLVWERVRTRYERTVATRLPVLDDALQSMYVRSLRRQARVSGLLVPLPQLGIDPRHRWTHGQGRGTYARWASVSQALRPGPGLALDIGSHSGFFSFGLAESGYQVIGYEPDLRVLRMAYTAIERARIPSVAFMALALDERNIGLLPQADVVLLLSVMHRWAEAADFETAKRMLRAVWDRTRAQLFFEMPNTVENTKVRRFLPDMGTTPDDAAAFVESMLGELPGATVRLLCHVPTDFRGESESRHLFVATRTHG